MACAEPAL